jgi:hypothetical protein
VSTLAGVASHAPLHVNLGSIMTVYPSLASLHRALIDRIFACEADGVDTCSPEAAAWYAADHETQRLLGLCSVYHVAEDNPPEGVVGVGIISYAEDRLIAAQA